MQETEKLYQRYAPQVNALILAIVGDREEAAELAQEVWVRVHGEVRRGTVPANAGTWIERLARSAARRHVARREARPEIPLGAMSFAMRADLRRWANLEELGYGMTPTSLHQPPLGASMASRGARQAL